MKTGSTATFYTPVGVAIDSSGNVYVADTNNNKIRKITAAGVVTTLAGSGSYGSSDGTGSGASFKNPRGVAVDSSGNVYVADASNYKIRKITAAGVVTTLAGSGLYGSSDGTGSGASFESPQGVAVDSSGNVYVADTNNNKIRKITAAGVVTTLAGSGSSGASDGTGSGASFESPQGVAVDGSGNVYVTDTNNNKIRKITAAGVVTTLAGSGSSGSSDGTGSSSSFYSPQGVAVDSSANVYVADSANQVIRKIDSGAAVSLFAGIVGTYGSCDGVSLGSSVLGSLRGIVCDDSGKLYVLDGASVKCVSASGAISLLADSVTSKYTANSSIAIDSSGNVYVADTNNNKIRKITAAGVVTTLAGSGSSGSSDGTGSSASFYYPQGVAVDSSGNVYVADSGNDKIRKISAAGVVTTFAGSGSYGSSDGTGSSASFDYPQGIAVDGSGNVYVADTYNHDIRKITAAGVVTTLAGSGSYGSSDGTGSSASFYYPQGVVVDSLGNVYVADTTNNKIRMISPSGIVTTIAGGTPSGCSDGIGSTAKFNLPTSLTINKSGTVYVIDSGNSAIREFATQRGQ